MGTAEQARLGRGQTAAGPHVRDRNGTPIGNGVLPAGIPRGDGARTAVPSISVVVPVYRSRETLPPLVDRLVPVLDDLADEYEVILVNDGSPDGSWEQIDALARDEPRVVGIDLRRNYGQHNALLCGIRAARHGLIVTVDDDLQHPPEEIPVVLGKLLAEDLDVVYGVPQRPEHGLLRNVASAVTKTVLQSSMGAETARSISAFRIFRADVREAFADYQSPFVSIDVLLTWGTTRFGAVPVRHEPRRVGTTNYTVRKLLTHTFSMLTGFSTLPLQIASYVGFAFTVVGLLVLLYVLGRYAIQGTSVAGFPFLASIVALFSGAQMFALGIMGEYLARMHFRSMERPPYTVRRRIAGPDPE